MEHDSDLLNELQRQKSELIQELFTLQRKLKGITPPLWQLARSFPVTGPQPLSSLRRAGNWVPGLGTEHLPGALCSGTGSPALGLCSP